MVPRAKHSGARDTRYTFLHRMLPCTTSSWHRRDQASDVTQVASHWLAVSGMFSTIELHTIEASGPQLASTEEVVTHIVQEGQCLCHLQCDGHHLKTAHPHAKTRCTPTNAGRHNRVPASVVRAHVVMQSAVQWPVCDNAQLHGEVRPGALIQTQDGQDQRAGVACQCHSASATRKHPQHVTASVQGCGSILAQLSFHPGRRRELAYSGSCQVICGDTSRHATHCTASRGPGACPVVC
jgi:hypothetical protein